MPGGSARSLSRLRSRLRSCARTPETASTKARTETETRAAEYIMGDGHEYTQDGEGRHSVGWPPDLLDAGGCSRRMGPARLIVGRHSEHGAPGAEPEAVRGSSDRRHGRGSCRGEGRRGAATEEDRGGPVTHSLRADRSGSARLRRLPSRTGTAHCVGCSTKFPESGDCTTSMDPSSGARPQCMGNSPSPRPQSARSVPQPRPQGPVCAWPAAVSKLPASRTPDSVPLDAPGWSRLERRLPTRTRV